MQPAQLANASDSFQRISATCHSLYCRRADRTSIVMRQCRAQHTVGHAAALSCLGLCVAAAIVTRGVAGIGENCTVVDVRDSSKTFEGTCLKVKDCTSKGWGSAAGYCHGPNEYIPDVQCCINATCSALNGIPGICKSTAASSGEQCQGGSWVPAGTACPSNKKNTFHCCIDVEGTVFSYRGAYNRRLLL
jgi:hypothetical protein